MAVYQAIIEASTRKKVSEPEPDQHQRHTQERINSPPITPLALCKARESINREIESRRKLTNTQPNRETRAREVRRVASHIIAVTVSVGRISRQEGQWQKYPTVEIPT